MKNTSVDRALGIVLTPNHITDFFCDLVPMTSHSVLYDPCCGTGSFLTAGMQRILQACGNDTTLQDEVKQKAIVGVEKQPHLYAYTCLNMKFRGAGKAAIYLDSCFDAASIVKAHKPSIAFLNPPYVKTAGVPSQLEFVKHALEVVSE